jgi:hypothetical protein
MSVMTLSAPVLLFHLIGQLISSDEACFQLAGYVNKQKKI